VIPTRQNKSVCENKWCFAVAIISASPHYGGVGPSTELSEAESLAKILASHSNTELESGILVFWGTLLQEQEGQLVSMHKVDPSLGGTYG